MASYEGSCVPRVDVETASVDLRDLEHKARVFKECEGREAMRNLVDEAIRVLRKGSDVDAVRALIPDVVVTIRTRAWDLDKTEGDKVVGRAIELDELLERLG